MALSQETHIEIIKGLQKQIKVLKEKKGPNWEAKVRSLRKRIQAVPTQVSGKIVEGLQKQIKVLKEKKGPDWKAKVTSLNKRIQAVEKSDQPPSVVSKPVKKVVSNGTQPVPVPTRPERLAQEPLVMPRLVPRRPSAQKKGNELTGAQVFFKRARRDREDAAKDRRAGEATAKARRAGEIGLFEQIKKKKDRKITKDIAKAEKPGWMPWNWKQISGPRDPSGAFDKKAFAKKEYETGIPFLKNISVEPPDEDDEFVGMNKKGGQIKKSVKKAKAKTRKRASLRGGRAELRGG